MLHVPKALAGGAPLRPPFWIILKGERLRRSRMWATHYQISRADFASQSDPGGSLWPTALELLTLRRAHTVTTQSRSFAYVGPMQHLKSPFSRAKNTCVFL